jgi:hypothetical protein
MRPTRWRQQFVPSSNYRYGIHWMLVLTYLFAAAAPLINETFGSDASSKLGGLRVAVLVLAALVCGMATDYARRSVVTRTLIVIGGMILYAIVLNPLYVWLGRYIGVQRSDPDTQRNLTGLMYAFSGIFPMT